MYDVEAEKKQEQERVHEREREDIAKKLDTFKIIIRLQAEALVDQRDLHLGGLLECLDTERGELCRAINALVNGRRGANGMARKRDVLETAARVAALALFIADGCEVLS